MREGRRKRLGLATGTTSTVGDTYLDRILTDEEAANTRNVIKADQNVNFDAGNYNYVTDLYDYFSSGGDQADTTPVVTPPSGGGGGGGGGGDSGGGTSVGSPPNDGGDGTFIGGGATLEDAGGTAPGGGYATDYYGDVTVPDSTYDEEVGINTPADFTVPDSTYDEEILPTPTYADSGDSKDTRDPDLLDAAGGEMGGADGYGIINDSPDLELENQYEDEDRFTEDTPIDYSEFDDLEADAGSMVTAEDVQDEQTFMDKFKGLLPENFDFKKAVISGLISAVTGKPIMMALDILKGSLSETSSQTEYDSYSPEEKAAIDAAYGSGGVMDGYNAVSGFGEGVEATVNKRIDDYEKNYTSAEIEGFLTNPKHTYSKLKDLQNKAGLKTTEDTETDDDSESDMLETLDLDLENQYEDDDRFTDTPEPEDIDDASDGDLLNPGGGIDISDIEAEDLEEGFDYDTELEKANKAAADKAKAEAEAAMQQKIRDQEKAESDRVEKANKAAADKAKAEAAMQQKIRDQEKAESDRVEKANKAAADKAKAEAAMQQKIRDQEKAESDRVEKANKAAADKAKAEAAMQQKIRDQEKAESDRVEKANKAAADKAKAEAAMQQKIRDQENQERERQAAERQRAADKAAKETRDMQQRIRDAEKAKQQQQERDDRDRQNEQDAKDNQMKDEDGNTYGGSCFIAGTKVTMADGTLKKY